MINIVVDFGEIMGYHLMIKEAVGLGIKYLCKCGDYTNPMTYKGSGTYWRRIIKKHNPEIKTTILGYYETKESLRTAGEYYSELYDVVKSREWANLIPEIGDGGSTTPGQVRAYDPEDQTNQKYFSTIADIPEGWIHGAPKWKKNPEGVEKSRQSHLGRKRPESTRENMRNSVRGKRMTIPCQNCGKEITPQNIKRHEKICKD